MIKVILPNYPFDKGDTLMEEIITKTLMIMGSTLLLGFVFAFCLGLYVRFKKREIITKNSKQFKETLENLNLDPYRIPPEKEGVLNKEYFDKVHPPEKIDLNHIMEQMEIKNYLFRVQMDDIQDLKDETKKPNKKGAERLYDLITEELLDNGKQVVCLGSTKHAYLRNINTVKLVLNDLREDLFLARSELHSCIHGVERVIVVARNPVISYEEFDALAEEDDDDDE